MTKSKVFAETVAMERTLLEIKNHKPRKAFMIMELLFFPIDNNKNSKICPLGPYFLRWPHDRT
jgi:hypothetical protein